MSKRFLVIGVLSVFTFTFSCFELRENVKKLQACKYRILETKTERIEILSFPPVPKILMSSILEIENPNDTEVKVYKFDLALFADNPNGQQAELAKVISTEETTVPAFSKSSIPLRIETSFENRNRQENLLLAILIARSLLAGKDPNLRIKGVVKYQSILGEVDLPVDEKLSVSPKRSEQSI
ncbi:LEA type 2 family protein [Leptospira wolffii]|uniref:NDR1/HIN1-like protein n=1 Tax=Leptospira wolffii TaxID=409998 RepID=UPI0003089B70|nr:LEA type 2 family protein [Leptospira wolffii]EPG64773.1 late embryogenesis abundant protein [Leptospira wolffii serovar Khorat str. Khorat-H2]